MRTRNSAKALLNFTVGLAVVYGLFGSALFPPAPAVGDRSANRGPASTCDVLAMKWNPLPFDREHHRYHAGCEPSVLYSWLSAKEVIDTKDPGWPTRVGKAFFHRTPLSTFLYGNFSYRVKLKPGTKFKHDPDWDTHYYCRHPASEKEDTVYIWSDANIGFSEYVLCSNGPIESWSFGMPEHFEEMKRERALVEQLGYKNMDGFVDPSRAAGVSSQCKDCFMGYQVHDSRNAADVPSLNRAFALMKQSLKEKEGRVYYPDTGKTYESGPEADKHFEVGLLLPFHKDFDRSALVSGEIYGAVSVVGAQAADGDVSPNVRDFCDGRPNCTYKISRKFLKGEGTIPSFGVRWKCCDSLSGKCGGKIHSLSMKKDDLEGFIFDFGCDSKGEAVYGGHGDAAPELEYAPGKP